MSDELLPDDRASSRSSRVSGRSTVSISTSARGEVHCLLGQNGAGKSTLIRVLTGAHQPDAGTIHVNGEQVSLNTPDRLDAARHRRDLPGARPGA